MTGDVWGALADRYGVSGPRRLLALDGGGIRGVLTLAILAEVEKQLAAATGDGANFRLSQFFDYVAGTSTGAIIAAGVARGMSAQLNTSDMQGSMRRSTTRRLAWLACSRLAKWLP